MYTLKLSLMETVQDSLRTLMLDICNIVYKLIAFCYEVLYKLGTINLLQDEAVQNLISRVTLIIGIFMVFRVTFAFVQYIVDPDAMLDKSKGVPSIVKKIIISIVLLGSTPYLFSMAFKIQKTVLDSHVLERLIFANDTIDTSTFGGVISSTVFTTFYRINEGPSNPNVQTYVDCKEIVNEYLDNEISTSNGSLDLAYACLLERTDYPANPVDKSKKVGSAYIVDFDGGGTLALVAGLVTLYISFLFTLQIGVRMFQLVYLQIVSPIPIAMYITPKGDDQLKKWGQQCLTTFLDLFLRIIIIYLAMFLIEVVRDNNDFKTLFGGGALYNAYVTCILMIAILIFAKKIPNLLKEIFPSLGGAAGFSYSLKMPDEAKKVGLFGAGAIVGGIAGMATGIANGKGTLTGRAGNAFTGFFRGVAGGAKTKGSIVENVKKGMASQRVASQKAYERNNDGSTFWGRTLGASGASRTKEAFDKELSLYSDYNGVVDLIDKELEEDGTVQAAMASKQALIDRASNGGPLPTAAEITAADEAIKTAKKASLKREIDTGANKKIASALSNAEAIRAKGQEKGYAGFGKQSISSGTAEARADAYFDNKDKTGIETNEIKGAGGSRNAAYKQAEANAKYNKTK